MTTQITPTTELQSVNIMLSVIGEAPVNSITGNTTVDVSTAINILNETSLSIQSEGHHFNTQYKFIVSIDSDGRIPLPSNCVQADSSSDFSFIDVTMRNGFLYNLETHTDIFTVAPTLDVILIQQFEHLPEYARRYITMKAARRFASRYLGDDGITNLIGVDEQEAHTAFYQADARNADANVLTGNSTIYNIISRTPRRTF